MFSKFYQSRDETATVFATSRTHVVSGSEAIHYARDHVRIVPIEVGNERVYVQCGHAVQTAVHVHVLGRIVK